VIETIFNGWMGPTIRPTGFGSLPELIDRLERGGAEEYMIEVDDETPDPTRARVNFLSDHWTCSLAAMLHELRRLDGAYRGEPAPGSAFDPADW